MKSLDNAKQIFGNAKYALYLAYRTEKKYYLYRGMAAFADTVLTLADVIFPAVIIAYLYPNLYPEHAAFCAVLWGIICLSVRLSKNILEKKTWDSNEKIAMETKLKMDEGVSCIRYEELELLDTQDELAFAKQSVERGSVGVIVSTLIGIAGTMVSLCSLIGILSRVSIFFLFLAVLALLVNSRTSAQLENVLYKKQEALVPVQRKADYTIWGLTDAKNAKEQRLYNMQEYTMRKMKEATGLLLKIGRGYAWPYAKLEFAPSLFNGIQHFIIYGWAAYRLWQGSITVSEFTLFTAAILQFNGMVSSIGRSVANIRAESRYIEKYCIFARKRRGQEEGREAERTFDGRYNGFVIEYQHVWYRYPGREDYALKDINTVIHPGSGVSIVGMNGSGKTTFIKLMMGFCRPTKGKILVNGVDLEELSQEQRSRMFAPVFQDYFLTDYSVRENITFSEAEADVGLINQALEEAGVREAVEAMPKGMECAVSRKLDPEGSELSGGEKQKLAIARALYKAAPFLIMDEPTAALSPNAEYEIYRNMERISAGRTVLFISHRLASCRFCSRIMVFNRGAVCEEGTHEELMGKEGLYYRMFMTQAHYYEGEGQDEKEKCI